MDQRGDPARVRIETPDDPLLSVSCEPEGTVPGSKAVEEEVRGDKGRLVAVDRNLSAREAACKDVVDLLDESGASSAERVGEPDALLARGDWEVAPKVTAERGDKPDGAGRRVERDDLMLGRVCQDRLPTAERDSSRRAMRGHLEHAPRLRVDPPDSAVARARDPDVPRIRGHASGQPADGHGVDDLVRPRVDPHERVGSPLRRYSSRSAGQEERDQRRPQQRRPNSGDGERPVVALAVEAESGSSVRDELAAARVPLARILRQRTRENVAERLRRGRVFLQVRVQRPPPPMPRGKGGFPVRHWWSMQAREYWSDLPSTSAPSDLLRGDVRRSAQREARLEPGRLIGEATRETEVGQIGVPVARPAARSRA